MSLMQCHGDIYISSVLKSEPALFSSTNYHQKKILPPCIEYTIWMDMIWILSQSVLDSDGDLVSFSSDDELTDALGYVNDGVFRIHIHPAPDGETPDRNEPCHKGVLCDGCETEICGPRFKCITCPDYDLCYKCEAKGMHQEHDMLRMCSPRPTGYLVRVKKYLLRLLIAVCLEW